MKKTIKVVLVGLLLGTLTVSAQFGLMGKKKKQGVPQFTQEQVITMQSGLLANYTEAAKHVSQALIILSEAFDLKSQAEILRAESEVFGTGNVQSKEQLQKHAKATEEAQKAIDEAMAENRELSKEAKLKVAESLVPYLTGAGLYGKCIPEAAETLKGAQYLLEEAPMMEKLKIKDTFDIALYLSPKIAGDSKKLAVTGRKYVEFAQSKGIEVPKDATDALGDL